MKTKILTICLLLFTSQVFSETWNCAYELNGRITPKSFIIKDNKVYINGQHDEYAKILKNNIKYIHIYISYPQSSAYNDFGSIVLNKREKRFSEANIGGHETDDIDSVILGKCNFY